MSNAELIAQSIDCPKALCIHHPLETQAERRPDAIAIVAPERFPLSFRRLLRHTEDIVKTLNTMGIGRNDCVAVVLPNGPEMAAAFITIASGAAFAPLNPACRANEFDFYLSDLNAKALIIQSGTDSSAIAVAQKHSVPIIELSPVAEDDAGIFSLRGKKQPSASQGGFAQAGDIALILYTSGTTSRPKMVPLTHFNLLASAGNIAATLQLTEKDRCLNVMPLFHIHGLIGAVLSSLMAGASVVCTPGFYAPRFLAWMEEFGPTWYTAVPTMHQAILARAAAHRDGIACSPLRFIRSSSAPLPSQVTAQLESVFNVPVIDSYGMTEACHQIASNPLPPRARKAGSVGVGAGTEIAVMDEAGRLLPSGETGEIVIRGANVTSGYENGSAANQSAFTNGWFKTGDQGFLDADGYLFLTGRLKEIINRGGEKISPLEVDEVLMEHPAVSEAVTFAVPHPTLGEEIAAALVLREKASVAEREVQEFAAVRLSDFKVPRHVLIVDEIPKSTTGKLQRIGLAEKLGLTASDQTDADGKAEFVAPRTPVEEMLAKIWSQVLKVEQVGIHDNFFDLGGDSILAAQIISRVRDAFRVELSFLIFFEAPTVAGMAASIEMTSQEGQGLQTPPIYPIPRDGELPLSFAQQRLWFLDQLEPGSSLYNIPCSVKLTGRLDIGALEQSLNEIVRRHEVLRTTFAMLDGQPIQVIAPSPTSTLSVVDLPGLPADEREARTQQLMTEEAKRPFDLTQGPLLRATVLRLVENDHVLLLVIHHIAADGWSMGVLLQELAALYGTFADNRRSLLPDLSIQYVDYAVRQRQWLQGEVLEEQLCYWKKQLSGVPVLELLTDRPRPPAQTFRGGRQSLVLPKILSDELKALNRKEGVTLFMTLLAAFQTLLHRYTGQEDIVVGSPIANRTRAEIEGLIGFFVNTLVLRTDLSGNPSFRELLVRVRKAALGAYEHQDLPFEKLVEELNPDRNLSHTPLFQVMFVLQNVPRSALEMPGLLVSPVEVNSGTAKFDMTLSMVEQADSMNAFLEYNTDLFDDATMTRMARHYQTLLEGIVANPGQRLSDLPILTDAERRQLLVEWNDTRTDYLRDKCIHELFEAQVERSPDAVAVVFPSTGSGHSEDKQLTYRELNAKANQLARHLQFLGVGPEVLVGICVERSLEMVVGLLGILKAGGAYLPLDRDYPRERLAFMIEDSHAQVLLTQQRLLEAFPEHGARVICLDTDWEAIAAEDKENPLSPVQAENLAYVIYTSGSTGSPKGVLISHSSIARHCLDIQGHYDLVSTDNVLQFAPLSFDASLEQILPTLISGARLLFRDAEVWSPEEFRRKISELRITVANLPTAYWRQLAPAWLSTAERIPSLQLRLVIVGGESMLPEDVKLWQQAPLNRARLLNAYGPTETAITATTFEIPPGLSEGTLLQSIPIGRPLGNRKIYILDGYGKPVPIAVPGELHIGGNGLARGYLNRPDLTAEKFIPDPFSDELGTRLYKTGDLARYLPDGNIEFLGRIDHQVKIRGFRIELGEIEAVLGQHPAVRETVVLARDEVENPKSEIQNPKSAGKRLLAYVVPNPELSPSISELRSFLKTKLPDYMVPSAFVFLDALPLTPNGKVNRRALPAPDQARPELENTFVPPRSPLEETLAKIWAEVLRLKQVGVRDDFFELGGHSLLAIQIASRVRSAFNIELPLHALFENPTVADLAVQIRKAQEKKVAPVPGTQAIPRLVNRDSLPASFAQQRLWLLHQLEPSSSAYNMLSAFRLKGRLNVAALEHSLNEISRRHEVLRTTFALVDGQLFQVISYDASRQLPVRDLCDVPHSEREEEAGRITAEEGRKPFDLGKGPLVRAMLLRISDEDHVFLYIMHHIVSDGWSMGIFYRELSALYKVFSSGRPSPLPDLPIQYADFSVWQRQWLQGEALAKQLSYWKQQLADIPVLNVPTDHARPAIQTYRGGRQSLALPKNLIEPLRELSYQEGVTLFMILLAAFKALLRRYTGQDDIVVGSPIAGRNHEQIEGLTGFFVNTLVLRTDLSGNPTFRELLARVRRMALDAYSHQDLPFEKLVEELQPERDLSRTPLFQIFFNMFAIKAHPLRLLGLTVEQVSRFEPESKFDLTLYVREKTQEIHCELVYNADLFQPDTASRVLGHFHILLDGIVANPNQRLSDLPILTEAEKQQLLVEWNDTERDYPTDECIHQLFEAQVERSPDAVAVVFEDKQLSYRELNQRANQVAHYLQRLGVGPEVLIGICVERSLEMVVGLLGILKAGGAYVPLDPAYPKARLAYMLAQTEIDFLLTNERLLQILPEFKGCAVCLDRDRGLFEREQEHNPDTAIEPDNLAYVTYTSGSTGKPKGVLSCHRGVANYFSYLCETYNLNSADTVLQIPSLSFDASVRDLIGPLTAGAKVVIVKNTEAKEPAALLSEIKERGVTCILSVVPTLLNGLLEAGRRSRLLCDSVRLILVSGEALTIASCQRAKEVFGHRTWIVNQYGPTESTMTCSYHRVLESDNNRPIALLGRPIPNARMYILDGYLNLVPIGISGELYIGGVGLARGYTNSPDLTAERFIPDPFSDEPGARLYKSGDLARYMPDGNIEFLGRVDHQVKIRGFRIELGEIEVVLTQHPAVHQAVAVVREDVPGDNRLVAYVVPNIEQPPTMNDLRNFLRSKLPEYMVPSAFVVLDAFPLTPNHKVDRRALPPPDQSRPDLKETFVAPRTPAEEVIAGIWAEVLKLEQVGVHDNFFDLGGHSLLATQVISRVRGAFQVELPLRALFENPTAASLAVQIAQTQAKEAVPEEMTEMLADVESLSEEEAQHLLAQESSQKI